MYKLIPYRLRIVILKYNYHDYEFDDIIKYYGYFKMDFTRKIFQIFYCLEFYPFERSKCSPLNLMYMRINDMEYESFTKDIFDLSTEYYNTNNTTIQNEILNDLGNILENKKKIVEKHRKYLTNLKKIYNLSVILYSYSMMNDITCKYTIKYIYIVSKLRKLNLNNLNELFNLKKMVFENKNSSLILNNSFKLFKLHIIIIDGFHNLNMYKLFENQNVPNLKLLVFKKNIHFKKILLSYINNALIKFKKLNIVFTDTDDKIKKEYHILKKLNCEYEF